MMSATNSEPLIQLRMIGRIRTSFQHAPGTPIQCAFSKGEEAIVEIFPAYQEGLKDLNGFERIWLLYHLDRATNAELLVRPYLDNETSHGIFATRSPARPNPIGISAVRLLEVRSDRLIIADIDMLDGTPLLDIKPYIPAFDSFQAERIGWYDGRLRSDVAADNRFERSHDPK